MPVPGSPILLGPILETSPRIRVRGVLAGATVTVVDDTGAEVARDRAPANGTAVLAVTGPLTTGRTVSARQETATGGTSTASPGLPVLAPPPTTPPPVFTVVLDVLSAAVRLDGLVLDADVTVTTAAGDVLARGTADRTSQWFRLGGSPGGPQERVLATQEFPGSARSEEATSEPIIVRSYESLPPPTVVAPRSCDTALMVDGVPATQLLIVRFDTGDELHWWSPGGSFRATLPRPLRGAELEAHTEVPMTGGTSLPTVVGIAPEPVPPAPVPSPFCPETGEVLVEGLVSEATVLFEVYEVEKEPAAPRTPLMEIGASGGRESFRLPHVVGGSGPLMAIEVTQRTCTLTSAPAVAHEFVRPGTPGLSTAPRVPARITEPAYSCSRSLEVVGGATTTSVRSAGTGELRADPFLPSGARMRIPLWAPLVADDELLLEEVGCGAPHDDHVTRVEPAPAPMPAPAVTAPLPGDTAITVGGMIADAVVSVSIDRVPSDVFIAAGPEAVVTVPPLR